MTEFFHPLNPGFARIMKAKYSQEKLIRRLEKQLLQPEVRQSAEAVADLLADDFIEFGSSGQVFNKQQIIEGLQQEPPAQRSLMHLKQRSRPQASFW